MAMVAEMVAVAVAKVLINYYLQKHLETRRGCNRMRFYRILVAVPLKYKKYQEN